MSEKRRLEAKVGEFLSEEPLRQNLRCLADALPQRTCIFLVGGAIRNLCIEVFHGRRPVIDDIDLFVDDAGGGIALPEILPAGSFATTDLGGIRWEPAGLSVAVDICLLKDFVIIKKYRLNPDLENLLAALDFTMNTLVFDLRSEKLHQRRALSDIRRRSMVFNTPMLYTRTSVAYRIMLLRHKTGFMLSPAVFRYVKEVVDLEMISEVQRILTARFGRMKMRTILADYDRICSYRDYDDYRRDAAEAQTG